MIIQNKTTNILNQIFRFKNIEVLTIILFMFYTVHNSYSTCNISKTFPLQGMTNISTNVMVSLNSNCTIDTSRLIRSIDQYADLEWDSLNLEYNKTLAFFIESGSYLYNDSSFLHALICNSIPGSYNPLPNGDILVQPTRHLKNNQQYDVFLQDLHVLDGVGTGIRRFDTIFTTAFYTIPEMYKIDYYSVNEKEQLSCDDSIYVKFNRKINSNIINNQNLLTLKKVTGINYIDSLHHNIETSNIQISTILSPDSLSIIVINHNLDPGRYILETHLNELTGNPNDFKKDNFYIGNIAKLTSKVQSIDANNVIPSNVSTSWAKEELYVGIGDSVEISAQLYVDSLQFKKWFCPSLTSVNNSTELTLNIKIECFDIGDHEIIALYDKKIIDTLYLPLDSNAGGKYLVEGYLDSLGNGLYTFERDLLKEVIITPIADSNHVFDYWHNNDGILDSLKFRNDQIILGALVGFKFATGVIFEDIGKRIDLDGDFKQKTFEECETLTYCIEFHNNSLNEKFQIYVDDIVELKVNGIPVQLTNDGYCVTYQKPFPSSINIELTMINNCYNNSQNFYIQDSEYKRITNQFTQTGSTFSKTFSIPADVQKCEERIDVIFNTVYQVLKVDLTMIDDANVPIIGNYIDIKLHQSTNAKPDEKYTYDANNPKKLIKISRYYNYPCGSSIDIYPKPFPNQTEYSYGYWQSPIQDEQDLTNQPVSPIKTVNGNDELEVLTVNMFGDVHVKYRFTTNFRLESFTYWKPKLIENNEVAKEAEFVSVKRENMIIGNNEGPYFKLVSMHKNGLGDYLYFNDMTPNTTEIGFQFSKSLDLTTVYNGNFKAIDKQPEIDYNGDMRRLDTRMSTTYFFNETTGKNSLVVNDREIYLKLSDIRNQTEIVDIPHMSDFLVSINLDVIRSIDGASLTNVRNQGHFDIVMTTENPSFESGFVKMDAFLTDFWQTLYGHAWAAVGFKNYVTNLNEINSLNSQGGVQLPNGGSVIVLNNIDAPCWSLIFNDYKHLTYVNRLNNNDLFTYGFQLVEKGWNFDAYTKFLDFSFKFISKLAAIAAPEWKIGDILSSITNGYNDEIGWFEGFFKNEDVILTNNQIHAPLTKNSLWGCHYLYYPQITELSNQKAKIQVKTYLIGQ